MALLFILNTYFEVKPIHFKEAKSAALIIFRKKKFSFQIICKSRIKFCFQNKFVHLC